MSYQTSKSECPDGAGQDAKLSTNDLDFATCAKNCKAEPELVACHAMDALDDLEGFVVRLGVCHE